MSVLRVCAAALAASITTMLACAPAGVHAAVLQVRAGESIAAAVGRAHPGDTVQVMGGTYKERILIDKPLRLEGIGKPTIAAGYQGDVIRVKSPDVSIRGLIVRDSGTDLGSQNAGIYVMPGSDRIVIANCDLVTNLFGIWLEQSRDAILQGNLVTGRRDLMSQMRGNGIQVYNTDDTQVIDNTISYVRDGIYVDYSRRATFRGNTVHHVRYGTHYMNTHNSSWEGNTVYQSRAGLALMEVRNLTVRNNVAWGNEDHGIMLRTIQDSVIENNIVAGNGRGFFIYDAEFNTLRSNLVIGNRTGVHLTAGSSNNTVMETTLSTMRNRSSSSRRRMSNGAATREITGAITAVGPGQRRQRRRAVPGQRRGRPLALAIPAAQAPSEQPRCTNAALRIAAIPLAARTERDRQARPHAALEHRLEKMAWTTS